MNKTDKENNICLSLEKKIFLITQFLSITKEMDESLKQKKEKDIIHYISKRQDCINKIKKIDTNLQKIICPDSGGIREIFINYTKRIKSLLEQVALIDASIMQTVKEEGKSIKEELIKMNTVRYAAKGYGIKGIKIPRYLDAKK